MIAASSEEWDWSDWVSPMLVKELRQGLRDRSFVLTFVAMQFSLAFLSIYSVLGQQHSDIIRGILAYTLCGVFFGLLPLWAAFSVSQEIKRNTLELMLMTRTSSRRLLFGKWTARVFQSFLIASTILPYVLIEYLKGSEELVIDLEFFLFLGVGNLILLATTVGLSVVRNTVVRVLCLLGLALPVVIITLGFISTLSTLVWDYFSIWMLGALTVGTVFVTLDLGSGDLTPESAHSPVVRRLLSTALFALSIGIYYLQWHFPRVIVGMGFGSHEELQMGLTILGIYVLFTYAAIELSREHYISWRLVRPYKYLGVIGQFLLLFFMPGRTSALLYVLPVNLGLTVLMFQLNTTTAPLQTLSSFVYQIDGMIGAILIPLLLHLFILRRLKAPAFIIGLFNAITIFLMIFLRRADSSGFESGFLSFFPCFATMISENRSSGYMATYAFHSSCSVLLMIGVLVFSAIPWFRELDRVWSELDWET